MATTAIVTVIVCTHIFWFRRTSHLVSICCTRKSLPRIYATSTRIFMAQSAYIRDRHYNNTAFSSLPPRRSFVQRTTGISALFQDCCACFYSILVAALFIRRRYNFAHTQFRTTAFASRFTWLQQRDTWMCRLGVLNQYALQMYFVPPSTNHSVA